MVPLRTFAHSNSMLHAISTISYPSVFFSGSAHEEIGAHNQTGPKWAIGDVRDHERLDQILGIFAIPALPFKSLAPSFQNSHTALVLYFVHHGPRETVIQQGI